MCKHLYGIVFQLALYYMMLIFVGSLVCFFFRVEVIVITTLDISKPFVFFIA
jgi:hypothetical protein